MTAGAQHQQGQKVAGPHAGLIRIVLMPPEGIGHKVGRYMSMMISVLTSQPGDKERMR